MQTILSAHSEKPDRYHKKTRNKHSSTDIDAKFFNIILANQIKQTKQQ